MPVRQEPLELFHQWFEQAQGAPSALPEAMTLSTSTRGAPSARMVLFKGFTRGGFTFYTHFDSRKGRELARNPRVALTFHWPELQRQVRVEGKALRCTAAESNRYFATRGRGSQLGAWASAQSREIADREALETSLREVEKRFEGRPVSRPPHWGGYRVVPERIEFWQGREHRLHERRLFMRLGKGWKLTLLSP